MRFVLNGEQARERDLAAVVRAVTTPSALKAAGGFLCQVSAAFAGGGPPAAGNIDAAAASTMPATIETLYLAFKPVFIDGERSMHHQLDVWTPGNPRLTGWVQTNGQLSLLFKLTKEEAAAHRDALVALYGGFAAFLAGRGHGTVALDMVTKMILADAQLWPAAPDHPGPETAADLTISPPPV